MLPFCVINLVIKPIILCYECYIKVSIASWEHLLYSRKNSNVRNKLHVISVDAVIVILQEIWHLKENDVRNS